MNERTLTSYLAELNSDQPAPGGGSAAAYVASCATALVNMALKVSIKRKSFLNYSLEEQTKVHTLIDYFDQSIRILKDYMEQDEMAFRTFLQALKEKKDTTSYQNECLRVPYELSKLVVEQIEHYKVATPYVVASIKGDLDMGFILSKAVLQGCIVNMEINLQGSVDLQLKYDSLQWIQTLKTMIHRLP